MITSSAPSMDSPRTWLARLVAAVVTLALFAAAAGAGGLAVEPAQAWWLAMLGLAFAIGGAGAGTWAQSAALIGAVSFAGATAQLAVTQPIWYQAIELRPKSPMQARACCRPCSLRSLPNL